VAASVLRAALAVMLEAVLELAPIARGRGHAGSSWAGGDLAGGDWGLGVACVEDGIACVD